MNIFPTGLQIEQETDLLIEWSDQTQQRIAVKTLRDHCPCAVCKDEDRSSARQASPDPFKILSDAELEPLRIRSMTPVGNYAYKITFSDGHANGIYSFEFLRGLVD